MIKKIWHCHWYWIVIGCWCLCHSIHIMWQPCPVASFSVFPFCSCITSCDVFISVTILIYLIVILLSLLSVSSCSIDSSCSNSFSSYNQHHYFFLMCHSHYLHYYHPNPCPQHVNCHLFLWIVGLLTTYSACPSSHSCGPLFICCRIFCSWLHVLHELIC